MLERGLCQVLVLRILRAEAYDEGDRHRLVQPQQLERCCLVTAAAPFAHCSAHIKTKESALTSDEEHLCWLEGWVRQNTFRSFCEGGDT